MKYLKYVLSTIVLVFSVSCNNDGQNEVLRWTAPNDVSSMVAYAGTIGGVPEEVDLNIKSDSLADVRMNQYFGGNYRRDMYVGMSVDFREDYATCVDSAYTRKIIAPYYFSGDSLFVTTAEGKQRFIAQGNKEELFRTQAFVRYILTVTNSDMTTQIFDSIGTVPRVLELEELIESARKITPSAMTNKDDSIIWCNVKYRFKK